MASQKDTSQTASPLSRRPVRQRKATVPFDEMEFPKPLASTKTTKKKPNTIPQEATLQTVTSLSTRQFVREKEAAVPSTVTTLKTIQKVGQKTAQNTTAQPSAQKILQKTSQKLPQQVLPQQQPQKVIQKTTYESTPKRSRKKTQKALQQQTDEVGGVNKTGETDSSESDCEPSNDLGKKEKKAFKNMTLEQICAQIPDRKTVGYEYLSNSTLESFSLRNSRFTSNPLIKAINETLSP